MIDIILSDKAYENDIYPLVKAFYPNETIKVVKENLTELKISQQEACDSEDKDHDAEHFKKDITLWIDFYVERIIVHFHKGYISFEKSLALDERLTKSQYKNSIKRFLYDLLSGQTGSHLPWGILTGIRPTKLVYDMLIQGRSEEEIYRNMKEEYYCSEGKTSMSIQIARRERKLLEEMDYKNGYSLYIGIPFCPSTCLYCSFTSYSIEKFANLVEDYLKALEKEIEFAARCFPDKPLTTVYFGGGTPTTLTASQLDHLLGLLRRKFDFTHVKEFCVEAGRPDSITRDKLEVLKKWGVDRISINPQSMNQKTLDLIGRKHTIQQVEEAFALAREVGHDNINMDIIIGLTGENPQDVSNTLKRIEKLNPESLTVHTLAVKRAARLNIERETYDNLQASGVSTMLEDVIHFAKEHSYLPYYLYRQKNMAENLENIGYSKYGREGLYNILIMEEKQTILALGAGAMSKFVFHLENRLERVDNVKSVTDYISRIDEMIMRKQKFINENPGI